MRAMMTRKNIRFRKVMKNEAAHIQDTALQEVIVYTRLSKESILLHGIYSYLTIFFPRSPPATTEQISGM
jgi:hypothetical protein